MTKLRGKSITRNLRAQEARVSLERGEATRLLRKTECLEQGQLKSTAKRLSVQTSCQHTPYMACGSW